MTLNRTSTSLALSADVGSSIMRMRVSNASARAISTICCWPRRSSLDGGAGVDGFVEVGHQRAYAALLGGVIDAHGADDLAAHENVVAHAEVGRQTQFLVDDRDAARARLVGGYEADALAVQLQMSRGRRDDARQDFHQGRFAGAVLAEQRRHLGALDVEIDAAQGARAAIGLGDVAGRQNDGGGGAHLTSKETGVTSQLLGLKSWNTPTTLTVLPVKLALSIFDNTCFFISLLSADPAF